MTRTHHTKKIDERFYAHVISGDKSFEYRREDDVTYNVGDTITLVETKVNYGHNLGERDKTELTGREVTVTVTYTLRHEDFEAVPKGWVIVGIKL